MRGLDFSSWQGLLSTLLGLAIITLIGVGIRLLVMQVVQQKREAANRQINERLKTLIAAYKTLGGSFTGDLSVDPSHLRDLRRRAAERVQDAPADGDAGRVLPAVAPGDVGDRARRIRDAVEGALSDVILLGTEAQVRLAARAATDMVEGRPIHTAELVVSLRDFIRQVLDLDTIPGSVAIPRQGPTRPGTAGGGKGAGKDAERGAGGKGGGGAGGMGAGMGMGAGLGYGAGRGADEDGRG